MSIHGFGIGVVVSLLLTSCGGSDKPSSNDGASAPSGLDGANGNCPAGLVWAQPNPSAPGEFTAFCGQPCSTTSDCPADFHCVDLLIAMPNPGPVCVSATVPPAVANPQPGWHWDMTPSCRDAFVFATTYNQPSNQVAGHELVTCANGCVQTVDGGVYAHCR